MNALAALSEMTVDEYFERIGETFEAMLAKREAGNKPTCPDEMSAADALSFFTHKSYSDLNQGVAAGRYPQPVTAAGNKRVWRKKDWDVWQAGLPKSKRRS